MLRQNFANRLLRQPIASRQLMRRPPFPLEQVADFRIAVLVVGARAGNFTPVFAFFFFRDVDPFTARLLLHFPQQRFRKDLCGASISPLHGVSFHRSCVQYTALPPVLQGRKPVCTVFNRAAVCRAQYNTRMRFCQAIRPVCGMRRARGMQRSFPVQKQFDKQPCMWYTKEDIHCGGLSACMKRAPADVSGQKSKRTFSSVGQSIRLITGRSGVRVPEGPPLKDNPNTLFFIGTLFGQTTKHRVE